MHTYPNLLTEMETINQVIAGKSLARFGDGELKLCFKHNCISQPWSMALADDLREILSRTNKDLVVGIPNIQSPTPKFHFWWRYLQDRYLEMYKKPQGFGSSFITRPDSAPWIDCPVYWERITQIWEGKGVTLVSGGEAGLNVLQMPGAKSVKHVKCPERNAYPHMAQIMADIKEAGNETVVLCCGPTATVLASKLSGEYHAIDLGHLGLFIGHQGIYKQNLDHLITAEYQAQNTFMHNAPEGYGGDGYKKATEIRTFAEQIGAGTILDYGCGEGTLKKALKLDGWAPYIGEYDPGVEGKTVLPKPADLVVCSDVLQHIEPDKLHNVIDHICRLIKKGAYFYIATRPANKTLPDGRNTHLVVKDVKWWRNLLSTYDWKVVWCEGEPGHSVTIKVMK